MTKYQEIRERFKNIRLGVVRIQSNKSFYVYFLDGIQKGNKLAEVYSLESLESLLKQNE